MNISDKYDVIIIGGGPAGCATALMLNKLTNLNILVIESGHYAKQRAGESIPPDTRLLLKQLNIWQEFLNDNHDPCLGSHSAWGMPELGYNDFMFNPMGHGWHLNRQKFDQFLAKQVQKCGIDFIQKTKVYNSHYANKIHKVFIKVKNGFTFQIESKFIVDASGINSSFSKRNGSIKITDDELVCITSFYKRIKNKSNNQLTLLEATEYGWWYAAQLPDNQFAIALTCDKSFSQYFKIYKHNNWIKLLHHSTSYTYKNIHKSQYIHSSIRVNFICSYVMDNVVGQSWLATGDAACAFDPISAGGIYKALTHGISAAKRISQYFSGQQLSLFKYEKLIKSDFSFYLQNKKHLYQLENRWQNSPFWKNRQSYKKSEGLAHLH